jgi:REP element-mobilizing transposase RayT
MARRNVVFLPGQIYHIYNRGASREDIFRNTENYDFLLRCLRKGVIENQVAVLAYCLMPNHYHFLFRQDGAKPIGGLMQSVFNSYTKAFNHLFERTGTLFEAPFKAIVVEKYEYLLHLCRYIHRNPVDAGLVSHPADWVYSNYREWVGKRRDVLTDMEFVCENYPNHDEYEDFVLNYIPPEKTAKDIHRLMLD